MRNATALPASRPGASGTRYLARRHERPMATDVSVQIAANPGQESSAEIAANACMTWFHMVDQCLSRFKPESEISRLNAAAGSWFDASAMLLDAVAAAVRAARASAGLFDPTMLGELSALGYDRDFSLIAWQELAREQPAPRSAGGQTPFERAEWRAIEIDRERSRIRLPEGTQIDLGGIAKGWAADIALARFCGPFPGALLNVGGDLRARGGPAAGTAWSVGIRDPRFELQTDPADEDAARAYPAIIAFSRGGLATSGAQRRWWLRDGRRQHHLLDPRTGQPMRVWIDARDSAPEDTADHEPLIATATALAPTAARAEVAAKVALLRGAHEALRAVESAWERYGAVGPEMDVDAGVALALTFGDGSVRVSGNMEAYLATWGTDGAPLSMNVLP